MVAGDVFAAGLFAIVASREQPANPSATNRATVSRRREAEFFVREVFIVVDVLREALRRRAETGCTEGEEKF